MNNRWSDQEAAGYRQRLQESWGQELAERTYSARLLGSEPSLVLHGGGNTSCKGEWIDLLGEPVAVLWIKASGCDLATIAPEGHIPLRLAPLLRLRSLKALPDRDMMAELGRHALLPGGASPSIEALLHLFLPHRFIDHTHADAILALTNRPDGSAVVRRVLGERIIWLPYHRPGFALAAAAARAFDEDPTASGMVLGHHGLVTWGSRARDSYEATIRLVTLAEEWLAEQAQNATTRVIGLPIDHATLRERYCQLAPRLRGALSWPSGDADHPWRPTILQPLFSETARLAAASSANLAMVTTPPLTGDHLIRIKPWPLWIENPEDPLPAIRDYRQRYLDYLDRNRLRLSPEVTPFDPLPRVLILHHLGVVATGADPVSAGIALDLLTHNLMVKGWMAAGGASYQGLEEEHLFDMEYHPLQQDKLAIKGGSSLRGRIVLITGAAGAIGSGITEVLLEQGALVVAADLPGTHFHQWGETWRSRYPNRLLTVTMDVGDAASVATGLDEVVAAWGGLDGLVINAGLAHAAPLPELSLEDFQRLERVNVEGTLHLLKAAQRLFREQGLGGDVVLISTKNVFAPGAGFGAYSATKAAAHQLARIAALEMAPLGVRVNMVAPDAVFAHGGNYSGLWATVGPGRMQARGLDAAGLEEYYQNRNLLKAKVSALHVGRAVVFFLSRQTPTTGATLPVDGGLPDAVPR